jgi:hypothetical protein
MWYIKEMGMGNFLDPPGSPQHTHHVQESGYNGGCMCLESAAHASYVPQDIRDDAAHLLSSYQPPSIDSTQVQEWILQVLGYFPGCYRNPDAGERQWHASDVVIDKRDAIVNQDDHCGVHHIRKWYPDYKLTQEHLSSAYWGSKL